MDSLVHSPGFTNDPLSESGLAVGVSVKQANLGTLFRSLPPERVGLTGEYDHSGLAKRVDRALRQNFLPQELETLKITQRGRVVVLAGHIFNERLLQQFVDIAAGVNGAATVETFGVKLTERSPTSSVPPN